MLGNTVNKVRILIVNAMVLGGCATSNYSNNSIQSYPQSGSYTVSAVSTPLKTIATGKGIVSSNGRAKFEAQVGAIGKNKKISNLTVDVTGRFQLNSKVCFSGTEELPDGNTTAFIVVNCSIENNTITGEYQSNYDYGILTASLN